MPLKATAKTMTFCRMVRQRVKKTLLNGCSPWVESLNTSAPLAAISPAHHVLPVMTATTIASATMKAVRAALGQFQIDCCHQGKDRRARTLASTRADNASGAFTGGSLRNS